METSISSHPERGPWGNPRWRGNASGYFYKDLFEALGPKTFVDPMVGSGTSVEVAREMGIEAVGLDLHSGFNILRDSILEIVGRPADLVFSHPPYHDMIVYSGEVWGDEPHPDDLSRAGSVEEFADKLHQAVLNQRTATKPGGHYGVLIGDLRRQGRYYSFQAELIARLPTDELAAVLVKVQHNVSSNARNYRLRYPRIMHEYALLWRKQDRSTYQVIGAMAFPQKRRLEGTWRALVRQAMVEHGGEAALADLYRTLEEGAPERVRNNPHWKAKVRQVLQRHGDFRPLARGVWALAA
ncbi:hypothetical protein Ocepr_2277 (plasmid) [Oceanithermus profundus DSM 14977]|uniref:DNA methylase n=1 Tax=Oceanithermus profundus (strain DSM 14977 / NBRC 100410 / VKM B-2274 / 506) TaxID=670487 RepID=E4UAU0_OCEP5|nr:hypothetical protein [Oceanithermus profundus]ADR37725.1 hypothetical protein Ocepr_2277 [Oceanithermus profundus DSM 14977]